MIKLYAPVYYSDFHCIANKCLHNCCIGWEIDIDRSTLDYYQSVGGEFGKRLSLAIDREDEPPHFCLIGEEERCPFLNGEGLCDIIITLGKSHLSEICTEHPRFYHLFSDRLEVGLGLCCEEACRVVLSAPDNRLVCLGCREDGKEAPATAQEKWLRAKRAQILESKKPLKTRMKELFSLSGISARRALTAKDVDFFASLERMDDAWDRYLHGWRQCPSGGSKAMQVWEKELSRLLDYLIYRHTAKGTDFEDFALYCAFAAFSVRVIAAILDGVGTDQKTLYDVCRLYSAEIEYSEENTEAVLDYLYDQKTVL